MRTASCADAGRAMAMEMKPAAISTRRAMPDMVSSLVLSFVLMVAIGRRPLRHVHATPGRSRYSLLDLDPGVLDHLAPALFLAAKIPVERRGRLRHHDE